MRGERPACSAAEQAINSRRLIAFPKAPESLQVFMARGDRRVGIARPYVADGSIATGRGSAGSSHVRNTPVRDGRPEKGDL